MDANFAWPDVVAVLSLALYVTLGINPQYDVIVVALTVAFPTMELICGMS
jgi:hypothetical protein